MAGGSGIKESCSVQDPGITGSKDTTIVLQVAVMLLGILSLATMLIFVTVDYFDDSSVEPNTFSATHSYGELPKPCVWIESQIDGTSSSYLNTEISLDISIKNETIVGSYTISQYTPPLSIICEDENVDYSLVGNRIILHSFYNGDGSGEYIARFSVKYVSSEDPSVIVSVLWSFDIVFLNTHYLESW